MKLTTKQKRAMELASEKGASSILELTTKPLKKMDFDLSKSEFKDFLKMHIGDDLPGLPRMCSCGAPFSVDHSQQCHLGGFVDKRHDDTRDWFYEKFNLRVLEVECY